MHWNRFAGGFGVEGQTRKGFQNRGRNLKTGLTALCRGLKLHCHRADSISALLRSSVPRLSLDTRYARPREPIIIPAPTTIRTALTAGGSFSLCCVSIPTERPPAFIPCRSF